MSPSIVERIRVAERRREEERVRLERERVAAEVARKVREAQEIRERIGREEREAKQRINTTEGLLLASRVLSELEQIENELQSRGIKTALVVNIDNKQMGSAILVWGNRFRISKDGNIGYEKGFLGGGVGVRDCSAITVDINPYRKDIGIRGANSERFSEQELRNEPQKISDQIVECYLNPKRYNDDDQPHYSSSSSSTECCCQ